VPSCPTILIADDDPPVRQLLVAMLRGTLDARLLEAGDGAEALALARREQPALAILDEQMPGLTGSAVCRALKQEPATASIGVLLFTGSAVWDGEALARSVGADGFFREPLGFGALRAQVQAWADAGQRDS
jgi:putative two-component system response regulator